jgi:prepilin-type N-terminal cleavage/methylation domain-containing protein
MLISKMTHKPQGFTLLEVMIAVAVLAIALAAVLGLQSRSLTLAAESRFNTTSALLAQGKMAEMAVAAGGSGVGLGGFRRCLPDIPGV